MEHFEGIFVNDIVQDFKKIGVPVKTDKQVPGVTLFLPIAVIKPLVVQNIVKSYAYIRLAYAVLESRVAESDVNIHSFSILREASNKEVTPVRRGGGGKVRS
jgi:hypothetical protein